MIEAAKVVVEADLTNEEEAEEATVVAAAMVVEVDMPATVTVPTLTEETVEVEEEMTMRITRFVMSCNYRSLSCGKHGSVFVIMRRR